MRILKKIRNIATIIISAATGLIVASTQVFADGDAAAQITKPITNLINIVSIVATAGGVLFALFEVIQLGIAIKSQDSSARANAVKGLIGAGIVAAAGIIAKALFS